MSFSNTQVQMLQFISQKLATGMRVRDLLALKYLLSTDGGIIQSVSDELIREYNVKLTDLGIVNLVNMLTNQFSVSKDKNKFKDCIFITKQGKDYCISEQFKEALSDLEFKSNIEDLIDFGITRYKNQYENTLVENTPFSLYEKYNYEQVCQLLEWPKNAVAQNVGGYQFNDETNTCPVFINYHKDEMIQDSIKYEDEFLSPILLKATSKARRYLDSPDVDAILRSNELGIAMHLFVRKKKDDKETQKFYYLGPITMAGGTKAVELEYELEVPVRDDIYDYIING